MQTLLEKPLSSNSSSSTTIRFFSILCIYLTIIVCIEFVIILVLSNGPISETNSEGSIECESTHRILKRQSGRGWQGQVSCPAGCVRRRKKKGPFGAISRPESSIQTNSGSFGASGSEGLAGYPGSPGYPGFTGEPGYPGYPGFAGEPGYPGSPGYPGFTGEPGFRGPAGSPGLRGPAGSPGFRGLQGAPGSRGGASGQSGAQGPSGQRGRPASLPTYDLRSSGSSRGDQGFPHQSGQESRIPSNNTNQPDASQLLKEFRLYAHPECKDEVNHRSLMDSLKDKGKVSFMILIDLQDNEYCIVHS